LTEEGRSSKEQENMTFSAYYDALHEDDYSTQDMMDDPIAFKATHDPDTMHYHEAMRATC